MSFVLVVRMKAKEGERGARRWSSRAELAAASRAGSGLRGVCAVP